uniref:Hedgehog protein Hint domain-containing protein n=1 Tax=Ditylenchus dipsaci TaxID=166011 RepID=A0A915DC33_9BILA
MFLHRKREEQAIYLKLETKGGGSLKLTDFHLIYTSKSCEPGEKLKLVHARDLTVGQCVYMVSNETQGRTFLHSSQLTRITQVKQRGIYAPLTGLCHSFRAA